MKKIFVIILYFLAIFALGLAVYNSFKGESATIMIIIGAILLIVAAITHRLILKNNKK